MSKSYVRQGAAVLPAALLMTTALAGTAFAACTGSADSLTLNCGGTLAIGAGLPITIYDAAAAYQPNNGSNAYVPSNPAFPDTGYDPNPPTVTLNFDPTATADVVNPTSASLADRALIVANYSNSESPAVNNVVINIAGSLALTTNQIAGRMTVITADSQVNDFALNNSGTLAVTQTFFGSFNAAKLAATASGSPATYTAKYNGATLNAMATLYSDDNTNSFELNNAASGKVTATGHFAAGCYGRADTTITNSGTIAHTDWTPSDTIAAGHWAIATYAGTDYATAPNTNPDSTIVMPNADGSLAINETSARTLTNNAGGVIKGDILALDITPLVYAAAVGSSTNPFPNPTQNMLLQLPVSNSSAGPRDSNLQNFGAISGNFYLGSGTHVIDNAAGATLTGSVYVDQRPIQLVASASKPGSADGTFVSAGGTDYNGNSCPAAGTNTANAGCATTIKVSATVVGGQSVTLTNEGTFSGDLGHAITLTGTGFSGNTSQVTMTANSATLTPGVTLVPNATITTAIVGRGGTVAVPNSTNLGSINGTLNLAGPTTIVPTDKVIVHTGDVYQVASSVTGDGASQITVANTGAVVTLTPDPPPA